MRPPSPSQRDAPADAAASPGVGQIGRPTSITIAIWPPVSAVRASRSARRTSPSAPSAGSAKTCSTGCRRGSRECPRPCVSAGPRSNMSSAR